MISVKMKSQKPEGSEQERAKVGGWRVENLGWRKLQVLGEAVVHFVFQVDPRPS